MTSIYLYSYIILANILILLTLIYTRYSTNKLLNAYVLILGTMIFLIGAFRIAGPDLTNYYNFYYFTPERIPDLGFRYLFKSLSSLSVPFNVALLFLMFLTLLSIKKICSSYKISFFVTFCVYFIYLMPIRDFSQIRIGLAISLVLIAYSLRGKNRTLSFILYCLSLLTHYSIILLIGSLIATRFIAVSANKQVRIFLIIISATVIIIVGQITQSLVFLDERILLYVNYKQDGYGNPVTSYAVLFYYSFILFAFYLFVSDEIPTIDKRILIYLLTFSIIIFISFANFSIFAFRLSHVVAAFHPIMVAMLFKVARNRQRSKNDRNCAALAVIVLFCIYALNLNTKSIVWDLKF